MKRYWMVVIYILLAVWFVTSILPILWTFLTSIKEPAIAFAMPPQWLFRPTLESYHGLWIEGKFAHYLLNSAVIAVVTVSISIPIGCLAGYALARFSGLAGFVLLVAALVFRMFPRIVFVIPFYYIARILGLYDTRLIVALVMISINQPFTIWLLRGFFMEIPRSLEESAMVDGCSRFTAFVRIVLPLVRPGMITASIFCLFLSYNDLLIPLVLTGTRAMPLPVAIAQYGAENIKYWSLSAAGCISIALPIVIVVVFAQKYLIKGLTFGAVKG